MTGNELVKSTEVSFFRCAQYYLSASTILSKNMNMPVIPFVFLVAHSLELFLKSYLLHVGVSENHIINKIGHNLEKAWIRAEQEGLNIQSVPTQLCEILNSTHNAPFMSRYSKSNTAISIPRVSDILAEIETISFEIGKRLGIDEQGNFV